MSDFVIGIPIGLGIGLIIGMYFGFIIGKNQKPWSELTEEEKRHRKIIVGVGLVILIIGALTGLWQFYNFS